MDATLYEMAKSGRVDLLSQVSDTNNGQLLLTTTPNKNTALHIAARRGHFNFAACISNLFPSLLTEENSRGDTALHIAARNGNALLAEELIDCANKNGLAEEMLIKRNEGLNTALHEAASNHHHFAVELLIRVEPELVTLVNAAGASPLYLAAEEGALGCVLELLQKTKELDISQDYYSGPHGRTPLHAAVLRGHLDVVKVLIQELPSLIKQRDSYSSLPLHYAASVGNLEMVNVLLHSDISTNYIMDEGGRSPFLVAAYNGHVGVLEEFLRFCPDSVEVADKKRRNVLHAAVESEKLEVMKYILKSDDLEELINEPDNEGNTPLHLAVIKRNVSMLNLLLKDKRVDMRATNKNGMTALEIAESDKKLTMKFRKIVICTALIQAGAQRGEQQLHTQANSAHAKIMVARIESYRAMSKTILVVAGLIITVTFAAAFSIPGGYSSDVSEKGLAVLRRRPAFLAFMITDAIALFSSIIVALLLIWAGIGDKDLLVGTVSIATRLMAIALGSLTIAFLSSLWLVVSNGLCIVVLSFFILVLCLSLRSFCFQFSLLLLFKQMTLNYLVYPIFNSGKRSAVQSSENMVTGLPVRVKSQYSITNIERLLVDSQPTSEASNAYNPY